MSLRPCVACGSHAQARLQASAHPQRTPRHLIGIRPAAHAASDSCAPGYSD